jgi:hypothetical protein
MRLTISLDKYKLIFLILILLTCAGSVFAQSPGSLPEFLSETERENISKENKEKDRTEALIKVSVGRLGQAQVNFQAENFALARDEVKYINSSVKKEGDKKKLFKMLDLSLRRDLTVLESLRYELPGKYADEANLVYEQIRKARITALGALFGKDFFPDPD